ncbi:MAG: PD40 domain-containing protein [Cryobacterium sp.]|nr:PD40 domain-containing protein [Oligoflexia bacterium]
MNELRGFRITRNFFLTISLLTTICVASPLDARAGAGDALGLSPFWNWKEIKTEHFHLVFPAEITAQAETVARLYEEANSAMKADMRWEPRTRVNVLLIDNTDAANGLTTPISRFGMLLYLTPPDPYFSTDYYEDWLKLLVFHEYTHFLNMDATRGFYSAARYIFGDVLLPNSTWPSWMLEGYAVYNETKFTRGGRGRSPFWEGLLRTIVEEKALGRPDYLSLDEINGKRPRFPAGEVAYLFGYSLMNTAERTKPGALSDMTERGSERVPYFINGNVEKATGKDWYALWDDWVAGTNLKMESQLAKIRSQPISKIEPFDGTHDDSYGMAFSPDGNFVAYSTVSEDEWQTLRFRAWKSGSEPTTIEDKFSGSGISFTPDGQRVLYSSLHTPMAHYTFYSDLRVFEPRSGNTYWLTSGARARDPDVSRDGKWIVYTEASGSATNLALSKITERRGRIQLEERRKLFNVPTFERVANPKFTPNGKGIVFSWKKRGQVSDGLYYYNIEKNTLSVLMGDAYRNRFPTFDRRGTLYFVSDRSGVDNVYRYEKSGKATLITNTTGAIALPTFRGDELFGSVLKKEGFSLAKIESFPNGIDPERVRVAVGEDAPAFSPDEKEKTEADALPIEVKNYSILPTLWPRQWAPFFLSDSNTTYLGAQVFGYDNTLRHQYFALGAFDSTAKTTDYSVQYENRSFGPTLALYASNLTKDVISAKNSAGGRAFFTRDREIGGTLSFPFQGTTDVFTPTLGYKIEQAAYYDMPGGSSRLLGRDRRIPQADFTLSYSNARSSRLSVAPERGGETILGVRQYDLGANAKEIYKGIFKHTQYFQLGGHTVLFPTIKAMKVNYRDFSYLEASSLSRGRRNRMINSLYSDQYDEFGIRGYPSVSFSSREAVTLSTDLRFPISQIFRGWGTNPFFLNQLYMQVFAEDTYRPNSIPKFQHLPSAGAGLRLNVDALLYVPLTFGVDYQKGFNTNAFGEGEVFFSVTTSSVLPF